MAPPRTPSRTTASGWITSGNCLASCSTPGPVITTSCSGGIACCTTGSPKRASLTTSWRIQATTGGEQTSAYKSRSLGSGRSSNTSDADSGTGRGERRVPILSVLRV